MTSRKASDEQGPQLGAKQAEYNRDPAFGRMIRNLWLVASGVVGFIVFLMVVTIVVGYDAWWLGLITLGVSAALGGPAFLAVVGTLNRTNPQRVILYAGGMELHYPIETIALGWDDIKLIEAPSKDPAITTYLIADPTDRRHILNNLTNYEAMISTLRNHVQSIQPGPK